MSRYFEILKQYVLSGGQVPSKKSWPFIILFVFILGGVIGFVETPVGGPVLFVTLIGLGCLAVLTPSITASVGILNDANRSGWWLLISFIPLIGSMILLGFMAQDRQSNENQGGRNPEDAAV